MLFDIASFSVLGNLDMCYVFFLENIFHDLEK